MARARTTRGQFAKGSSGNPRGRPRGSRNVMPSVRELVAEVLTDPNTRQTASEKLKAVLGQTKTVVTGLEFAARVNREIGVGSGDMPAGVTIIFQSNIDPTKLRAAAARALPPVDS